MEATAEFEFLKDLPQKQDDWPEELKTDLKNYVLMFKEHEGLIPSSVAPDLLQVSKQRFGQIRNKYKFWSETYFGKVWYSRRELENFSKVDRPIGKHSKTRQPASMLSLAAKIKDDLLD